MDQILTRGAIFMRIPIKYDGYIRDINLSVISRRAVRFVIRRSRRGEWKNRIVELYPPIDIHDGIIMRGFQPDTGLFIAEKIRNLAEYKFNYKRFKL